MGDRRLARRIAAILYFVPGLGIAMSTLLILAYLDRRGELPMTPFGWRLMGSTVPGMGADQLTCLGRALAWVLIGVSAVDMATGRWLWQDSHRGSVIGLATTPVSLGLGLLFQVPFLIVVAPLRAGLVIANSRRSSRPEAR
jgi:hypothetical protein